MESLDLSYVPPEIKWPQINTIDLSDDHIQFANYFRPQGNQTAYYTSDSSRLKGDHPSLSFSPLESICMRLNYHLVEETFKIRGGMLQLWICVCSQCWQVAQIWVEQPAENVLLICLALHVHPWKEYLWSELTNCLGSCFPETKPEIAVLGHLIYRGLFGGEICEWVRKDGLGGKQGCGFRRSQASRCPIPRRALEHKQRSRVCPILRQGGFDNLHQSVIGSQPPCIGLAASGVGEGVGTPSISD